MQIGTFQLTNQINICLFTGPGATTTGQFYESKKPCEPQAD